MVYVYYYSCFAILWKGFISWNSRLEQQSIKKIVVLVCTMITITIKIIIRITYCFLINVITITFAENFCIIDYILRSYKFSPMAVVKRYYRYFHIVKDKINSNLLSE